MKIEDAIYVLLSGQITAGNAPLTAAAAVVTAIVGAGTAARVYPNVIPQGPGTSGRPKYPAIVFHRISGFRETHMQGLSKFAAPRYQFDCWSKDKSQARAMGDGVIQLWDTLVSSAPGTIAKVNTSETFEIQGAIVEDDRDAYDDAEQVYCVQVDVTIQHAEP